MLGFRELSQWLSGENFRLVNCDKKNPRSNSWINPQPLAVKVTWSWSDWRMRQLRSPHAGGDWADGYRLILGRGVPMWNGFVWKQSTPRIGDHHVSYKNIQELLFWRNPIFRYTQMYSKCIFKTQSSYPSSKPSWLLFWGSTLWADFISQMSSTRNVTPHPSW